MRISSRSGREASSVSIGRFILISPFAGTSMAWLNHHSLGVNCTKRSGEEKRRDQKTWGPPVRAGEPSIGISLDLLLGKTEKALVEERREDRDDCHDDESGDSIELIQLRKIVEEKFENGDA